MALFTIFGHNGFIGTNLKKKLKNHNLILPKRNQLKIKRFLGHVIYCIGSDNWMNDKFNSYMANIGYIPEIIKNNKFKTFTFLSTTRIYKKNSFTNEESSLNVNPLDLNDFYNLKKICAESYLLNQKENIKIIRLSNIYGENFWAPLVLPKFITNSVDRKKIFITINKHSTKDFLSINEAVKMIYIIATRGKKKIYNVASGKNLSLIQIATEIQKQTNCKIILKNQNILIKEPKININRIKKEFKIKIKSNLIKDISMLIQKYRFHNEDKL